MTLARRFVLPLAASLAALSLSACGQSAKEEEKATASAAPEAKPGISVADGVFMLPAVSGNPGAAYFALDNESNNTVSIASIAIAGAGKTEIHQTMGGQMKPVDRVDVEAKTVVKFERGGLHVMAFEVDGSLKAGDTAEMTITFTDGDKVSAPLKLEAMGAGAMDHGSGH
ncbi:MAG: copper chaperone PCu(A)C [Sphingomonadales bacterium]|nr:copper chaperone PCu(A)C [Sphingomonadales bacterium]